MNHPRCSLLSARRSRIGKTSNGRKPARWASLARQINLTFAHQLAEHPRQLHHFLHVVRPDRAGLIQPSFPGTPRGMSLFPNYGSVTETFGPLVSAFRKLVLPNCPPRVVSSAETRRLGIDGGIPLPAIPQFAPALVGPAPPPPRHHDGRSRFMSLWGVAMTDLEHGELRVVVPVGFLLDEEQEVTVSVDRPDGQPLPIRLKLVPARTEVCDPTPVAIVDEAPAIIGWPTRRLSRRHNNGDDGYPGHDVGGGD
jgi:hypothetical protein